MFCSPRNLCGFVLFALIFAGGTFSRAAKPTLPPVNDRFHRLHFFHTRTGEQLTVVYRDGEGYDADSLARLNRYLRDHRNPKFMSMIPGYSTCSTT